MKKFKIPGFPEYDSTTCFLPELDNESYYYYSLYLAYCDGFLPFSGGILDQPNDFIEAKELLKAWHARTAQR